MLERMSDLEMRLRKGECVRRRHAYDRHLSRRREMISSSSSAGYARRGGSACSVGSDVRLVLGDLR